MAVRVWESQVVTGTVAVFVTEGVGVWVNVGVVERVGDSVKVAQDGT
jgi:hypothetical protein